jgi:hypothetical protein
MERYNAVWLRAGTNKKLLTKKLRLKSSHSNRLFRHLSQLPAIICFLHRLEKLEAALGPVIRQTNACSQPLEGPLAHQRLPKTARQELHVEPLPLLEPASLPNFILHHPYARTGS